MIKGFLLPTHHRDNNIVYITRGDTTQKNSSVSPKNNRPPSPIFFIRATSLIIFNITAKSFTFIATGESFAQVIQ